MAQNRASRIRSPFFISCDSLNQVEPHRMVAASATFLSPKPLKSSSSFSRSTRWVTLDRQRFNGFRHDERRSPSAQDG